MAILSYLSVIIHSPILPPFLVSLSSARNCPIILRTCRSLKSSLLASSALDIEGLFFISPIRSSTSFGSLWIIFGSSLDRFGSLWIALLFCPPNDYSEIFLLVKLRCLQPIIATFLNNIFCTSTNRNSIT